MHVGYGPRGTHCLQGCGGVARTCGSSGSAPNSPPIALPLGGRWAALRQRPVRRRARRRGGNAAEAAAAAPSPAPVPAQTHSASARSHGGPRGGESWMGRATRRAAHGGAAHMAGTDAATRALAQGARESRAPAEPCLRACRPRCGTPRLCRRRAGDGNGSRVTAAAIARAAVIVATVSPRPRLPRACVRTHATPCQYQGSGERARTAQSEQFECSPGKPTCRPDIMRDTCRYTPAGIEASVHACTGPDGPGGDLPNTFPASFLRAPGCPNASVRA